MMTLTTYQVTGMTCEHCVRAVTEELRELAGVTDVRASLVVGGTSAVTVTSAAPVSPEAVAAALDEAGAYRLADAADDDAAADGPPGLRFLPVI